MVGLYDTFNGTILFQKTKMTMLRLYKALDGRMAYKSGN